MEGTRAHELSELAAADLIAVPALPAADALAVLTRPVRRWFRRAYAAPTPAQCVAWPALAAGRHLLLSAPTGSGKTLAAFLPVLGRLLDEPFASGVRCLYIAPLKALIADTRTNLRTCLRGIRARHPERPPVRVGTRTGDTPDARRRRLRHDPPDILLTTPESLAVLLSQPWAVDLFRGVRTVVVDEVHALAASKRGADLALSLERLQHIAGDGLQRVGLSATCAPLAEAARFLAGAGRPCALGRVAETSPLELTIEPLDADVGFVARLIERLGAELARNHTTLIFTNTRALAERLTWGLGRRYPGWAGGVGVHHSALDATRRRRVERRLKRGELRAVISSTSLELGIDIGSIDGVVLVHPPGDVVRLLQRIGRAGHGPGRPRRGLVLTASPAELLEAAVTGAAGRSGQVEPLRVPRHPLDVLCQQLVGMAMAGSWHPDEAFALVRGAYPYRSLSRADFDDCLAYLHGLRGDGSAWLPARLRRQGERFSVRDRRTTRLLRRNLGTILAEEARAVRLVRPGREADGTAVLEPVGRVDEGYADRLRPGDRILLDGRCLEVRRADGEAVVVEEQPGRPAVPRWGGDGWPLAGELAGRLYLLRIRAAEALRDGPAALADLLRRDYGLGERAVRGLVGYFQLQECVSEIPDRGTLLVEAVAQGFATDYYFHTPLNRAGNDALARVLARRLARSQSGTVTSVVADLGFVITAGGLDRLGPCAIRELLDAADFDADLAAALADSAVLRERFRRVALTGLMLLRNPLGGRRHVGGADWAGRRLFRQVADAEPEFVLLRQALREVREESCDGPAARAFVECLPGCAIRYRDLAHVSPFASGWTQTAVGPVEADGGPAEVLERLHAALTRRDHSAAAS